MKYAIVTFLLLFSAENSYAQQNTIAIWPIEYSSLPEHENPDRRGEVESLVPALLANEFITAGLDVVEREKLLDVLLEQRLGSSVLVDEASRIALGRIIGAQLMLFGSYIEVGTNWQLALRIVYTETGKIALSSTLDQSDGELLDAAKASGRAFAIQLTE